MNRFNKWEAEHMEELTTEQRLERFANLFELQKYLDADRVELHHRLHLENLIETQRRLRLGLDGTVR